MKGAEAASIMFKGVKISNINYRRAYDTLSRIIAENGKGYVCVNDVGNLMAATEDHDLRKAINNSTLALADGMPLARFAQLVGCTEIERITGADLMRRMLSEPDGFKHFLLGDTDETLSKVIEQAKRLNNGIRITGHSPPFRPFAEKENDAIMKEIRKERPDVIWVSLGGVRQEKWMHEQIERLDKGVMIGAGAAFRWLIGEIPIPPDLVQNAGLQWLYRLVHECMKGPSQAREFVKSKKFLARRLAFLANLPMEIIGARKSLKDGKGPDRH
jgi:N-acetylglucosaminyldiphosphoundecaprenol N-acetyl-beta-D-mannosaminyltransferase